MPPRLNKRQLRQQEELQALQEVAKDDVEEQSEEGSPVASTKPPIGGFAAVSPGRGASPRAFSCSTVDGRCKRRGG